MSRVTDYPTALDDDRDLWDALKRLAQRRPVDPAAEDAVVQWEPQSADRYRVTRADRTIGYIEVSGAVFVALRTSGAERVSQEDQTLLFAHAVRSLVEADDRHDG